MIPDRSIQHFEAFLSRLPRTLGLRHHLVMDEKSREAWEASLAFLQAKLALKRARKTGISRVLWPTSAGEYETTFRGLRRRRRNGGCPGGPSGFSQRRSNPRDDDPGKHCCVSWPVPVPLQPSHVNLKFGA